MVVGLIMLDNARNCPNCGAPYDMDVNKCPYCGTSYYDLSSLDLSSREPFYLKIKTNMNGMPCYITQLVRAKPNMSIEVGTETVDYCDGYVRTLGTCVSKQTMTTNIEFEAVTSPNHKNLCTIEVCE
jgi:hypothetical protein